MFNRLSLVTRHLIRPIMTNSADTFKRPITTAACLIIGDEVLNGKVLVRRYGY